MNIEQDIPTKEKYKWYDRGQRQLHSSRYGYVMQDAIGDEMPPKELMKKYGITYDELMDILSLYYKKPAKELTLKSKV